MYSWNGGVEGEATTQESLDYLLTSTKEKDEIMMPHLYKQRLCEIMLERMWEKKSEAATATFAHICLLVCCHSNGAIWDKELSQYSL